jgi:hypothetical protein
MDKIVYLELSFMPGNCRECVLSTKNEYDNEPMWVCAAFMSIMYVNLKDEERPAFCPLKEICTSELHRSIIENFNPDDAETDRVLQEATERTMEKYNEIP